MQSTEVELYWSSGNFKAKTEAEVVPRRLQAERWREVDVGDPVKGLGKLGSMEQSQPPGGSNSLGTG